MTSDFQTPNSPPKEEILASATGDINLSKRKRKRLLREQRWLEQKPERKRREKEKRLAKRLERKLNQDQHEPAKKPKTPAVPMSQSSCKINIVIDCDYEDYMNEDEMRKLCKQINRCYAINRQSPAPCQLWFTSIQPGNGKLGNLLQRLQPGYPKWDVHRSEKHWSEIFSDPDSNVVYLSGDSTEIIPDCATIQQKSNQQQVFIIGGLIDHNRHKGLSLRRAEEYKVKHGQLPIGEYIRMNQRRILSIPHVFEIMLLAVNGQSGQDWTEIFKQVIPNRKLCNDNNETKK